MDPTLKARITSKLLENIPGYSKALSRSAKYIVDHPAEFGVRTIRDSASRIGVSSNTFVRLANALGFDSFDDLRAPFREALLISEIATEDEGWLHRLGQGSGLAQVQAAASANLIGNVSKTLRDLDTETLERVVKRLFGAKQVFVVGTRASYSLAYYFHYVGRMLLPRMSLIPQLMNPAIDDLVFADEADVMIAFTVEPYSRDTIRTCEFARKRGMGLILVSDSQVSAPKLHPEELLVASTLSTHHFTSYMGMIAVVETLLATLFAHGGAEAKARVSAFEQLRDETDAYWHV